MKFFNLHFDVSTSILFIIIFVSIVVWVIGVWWSNRSSTKNRLLKAVLWLACIFSLDALVLQPKYNQKQTPQKAVLFTDSLEVTQFSLNNWLNDDYAFFKLPHFKTTPKPSTQIKTVANVSHLLNHHKAIDSLYIIGGDMPINQLKNLPLLPIRFMPSKNKSNLKILSFKYTENLELNKYFELNMQLEVNSSIQKYVLQSPFSKIDTVEITKNKIEILYKAIGALAGNYLIKLDFLNANNTIEAALVLPLKVIPKQKANIVMLNGQPNFNHKHLKNWLAQQGHFLRVRT